MKSRNDFATFADYREYLIAYYAGQVLTQSGDTLPPLVVLGVATDLVDALFDTLYSI